jgi:hypothetical protein
LLGLEKPEYGEEQAYRTGQAFGNMPAIGAPVGAFKAAMQAPGLLADATQMAKQVGPELAGLLGLTAFHGSPHRFSKFDASKIGTGEGAQAYGHGLYFAESPNVAKGYQAQLSGFEQPYVQFGKTKIAGQDLSDIDLEAIKFLEIGKRDAGQFPHNTVYYAKQAAQNKPEVLKRLDEFGRDVKFGYEKNRGSFYTVDIPDEMIGRMLDWDKPLGQQKELKDVLNKIRTEIALPKLQDAEGAGFAYQALANAVGGQANASALLRQYGVPGIRYLDQGSRGSGKGTRNFVVFPGEEEAIKMLNME